MCIYASPGSPAVAGGQAPVIEQYWSRCSCGHRLRDFRALMYYFWPKHFCRYGGIPFHTFKSCIAVHSQDAVCAHFAKGMPDMCRIGM